MNTAAKNPFNDFVFVNATPADRGSFTLALDKALDKLEKFQLPDPSYFILQWIQALVASGATNIVIKHDNGTFGFRLRLNFDGPGYTYKELQSLYDHVFLSGRDRGLDRLRELALGWLSVSSMRPTRLLLLSNGWARFRDKTETSGRDVVQQHESSGLHLLEVTAQGHFDFEDMVTTRCSDVPIPLHFNDSQVSHPEVPTGVPWPNRPFHNGPTRGVMGATYGVDSCSNISFLRYGVNFVSRREPALVPPVMIRASDETLSKNVSQTDVVKDDAYEEFLSRLRTEMKTMGLALTGKRIPSYQRDSLNRYLQAYLGSNLDIRALEDPKRLAKLGPDYERLINFPVFCASKGVFHSLAELFEVYKSQGYLLYCLNPLARGVPWAGVLLVLEVEEVAVLRKFFPNLVNISLEDVKAHSRMGRSVSGALDTGAPTLAVLNLEVSGRRYKVTVEDAYPTGIAVLRPVASRFGTAINGLHVSMTVDHLDDIPPTHTEVVGLRRALIDQLDSLKTQLRAFVGEETLSAVSRPRAAELICEILNFQLSFTENHAQLLAILGEERMSPLIGLEDGRLVSLADLEAYLKLVPRVYVGGIFLEGLKSGALDPMPQASKLLFRLFPGQSLVPTERILDRLSSDPQLRFELRRQTVIRGLGITPNPQRVLDNFATEAAQEAAELERLEKEYRSALGGENLFVKPDAERLAAISYEAEESDSALFDLTASVAGSSDSGSAPNPTAEVQAPPVLPSLESDLDFCRHQDPDLLPERDSVQVERRETEFTYHLATLPHGEGKVYLLSGERFKSMAVAEPIRGVLRLAPGASLDFPSLYRLAQEQLLIKAMHTFSEGPTSGRMRKALRHWLLNISCLHPDRLLATEERRHDLFDQPVVPCLGGKYLPWRSLLEQTQRTGETVVWEGPADLAPCPNREVIHLVAPLSAALLEKLGFTRPRSFISEPTEDVFETLYRSTRRDLATILSGQSTPLLSAGMVEQLTADASLWKRWRSGFLSWDKGQSVLVMNPGHKIGKKLAQRFQADPTWSRVFASALFSTVNRGLEEVDDRHERAFLEGLVETLD